MQRDQDTDERRYQYQEERDRRGYGRDEGYDRPEPRGSRGQQYEYAQDRDYAYGERPAGGEMSRYRQAGRDWQQDRDADDSYSGAQPDRGYGYGGYGEPGQPAGYSWSYTEVWMAPGPYVGRGPRGYQRSDEMIREDVCERLTRHGRVDASGIDVLVRNGEVTLTGTVDSRQTKRLAEDTAETVSGIRDVHNQLRVSQDGRQAGMQPEQSGQTDQARQAMSSSQAGQMTTQQPTGATTSGTTSQAQNRASGNGEQEQRQRHAKNPTG